VMVSLRRSIGMGREGVGGWGGGDEIRAQKSRRTRVGGGGDPRERGEVVRDQAISLITSTLRPR